MYVLEISRQQDKRQTLFALIKLLLDMYIQLFLHYTYYNDHTLSYNLLLILTTEKIEIK